MLLAARKKLGDVHGPPDDCCPDKATHDITWLPVIAGQGFAILTHDRFERPGERDAVIRAKAGVFQFGWRGDPQRFERSRLVLSRWDDMLEEWATRPRPFIVRLNRSGRPRSVL